MLAILDYKAGNQTSVRRALDHLGIPCVITADPAVVDSAAGVIFPGVGAAGQAMRHLQDSGLDAVLRNVVSSGRPLLGICLGCQIMVAHSDENDTPTLGLVEGRCVRFDEHLEEGGAPIRIPHMGWNTISRKQESPILKDVPADAAFYFVMWRRPRKRSSPQAVTVRSFARCMGRTACGPSSSTRKRAGGRD